MIVKEPIAKKDHICDLCNDTIKTGEKYKKITSERDDWLDWDDDGDSPYQTFHRHLECEDAYNILTDWYNDPEALAYIYLGGTADAAYDQLCGLYWDSDFKVLADELGTEKYAKVKNLLDKMGVKTHGIQEKQSKQERE